MIVSVEIGLIFLTIQTYMYVSAIEDGLEMHDIKSMLGKYIHSLFCCVGIILSIIENVKIKELMREAIFI